VQVRNCKVKTTGIALSVDASVPPASAARGMGVHALSNHGKARAQGRDAARECRAFKVIRARSVLNRAATDARQNAHGGQSSITFDGSWSALICTAEQH
jgi:hypothetical protein